MVGSEPNTPGIEIKPGFTLKYFLLILLTNILSLALGYSAQYFFANRDADDRRIRVAYSTSENLLGVASKLESPLALVFSSTQDPEFHIRSYFQCEILLQNRGDLGIDDFSVFVEVDSGLVVLREPVIATVPAALKSAIQIDPQWTNAPSMAELRVELLNPGQDLKLKYTIYGDTFCDSITPRVILKKKDWRPEYAHGVDTLGVGSYLSIFVDKRIADFTGREVIIALAFAGGLLMYFALGLAILPSRRFMDKTAAYLRYWFFEKFKSKQHTPEDGQHKS